VIGVAPDIERARQQIVDLKPDVALVDLLLRMIARGHTSREVAGRLNISTRTVETHLNHKLGLRSTVDVLRFAAAHGIGILESAPPPHVDH
jgi:FixJ family two-component response regulator